MKLELLSEEIVKCRKCPRLVAWREEVAHTKRRAYLDWDYWGRPVPGFGDPQAQVLVVGLAPGAHGSNRTGRMFTGDASGEFLYAALHRAGFANQPTSDKRDDSLVLEKLFITAVCRCAPPDNKPLPEEISRCLPFLEAEMACLSGILGIVALGRVAFDQVIRLYLHGKKSGAELIFQHGACYKLGDGLPWLLASYHPSRQNTQTGRLTQQMFDQIWQWVANLLEMDSSYKQHMD
jgi:uracil-DNA glycosylase family 4